MGYELYITKSDDWTESEAHPISIKTWNAWVEAHPGQLEPLDGVTTIIRSSDPLKGASLRWSMGAVVCKTKDEETIKELLSIAQALNANLIGDDGERYTIGADGELTSVMPEPAIDLPTRGIWQRVKDWFELRAMKNEKPPFQVGDEVEDAWKNKAKVVSLNKDPRSGFGMMKIRYEKDGREVSMMYFGHGLIARKRT